MLGVASKVTTTISHKVYFPFLPPKLIKIEESLSEMKDFQSVVILKTRTLELYRSKAF